MDGRTSRGIATAGAKHESPPRRWLDDGLLRRVFKNAGMLLSGKAVGAPFGLGTTRNIQRIELNEFYDMSIRYPIYGARVVDMDAENAGERPTNSRSRTFVRNAR